MRRIATHALLCARSRADSAVFRAAAGYDVDRIGDVLRKARGELTIVCASRTAWHGGGQRSPPGLAPRHTRKNLIVSLRLAAAEGIECSEIDLLLDRAGSVVVSHDSNPGERPTPIGRSARPNTTRTRPRNRNWLGNFDKGYAYATEMRLGQFDTKQSFRLYNFVSIYYGMKTLGIVKTLEA